MLHLPFGRRRRDDRETEIVEALKVRLRDRLALGDEDALVVSEIACRDVGCPDRETVILVFRPDRKTEACKIGKPLALIEQADIDELRLPTGD